MSRLDELADQMDEDEKTDEENSVEESEESAESMDVGDGDNVANVAEEQDVDEEGEVGDVADGTNVANVAESNETESKGNVKDRNPSVSMYPPQEYKDGVEEAWNKINAMCSLANADKPAKSSDFAGAILKHGYEDIEGISQELGLDEVYEEYGDVVDN